LRAGSGANGGGNGSQGQGGSPSNTAGTANTGGGGGGDHDNNPATGKAGGSGIVIVRVPSAATISVSPGCNSTSSVPGGQKIATFKVSGTLTLS